MATTGTAMRGSDDGNAASPRRAADMGGGAPPLPGDATLVALWTLRADVGAIQEAAFYRRIDTRAFLWVVQGYGLSVHYTARRAESLTARRRVRTLVLQSPATHPGRHQAWVLVDRLFRGRPSSVRIREWGRGGLLEWEDFADIGAFTPSREFLRRAARERC